VPDDDAWPAELFALADLVTPMALRVAATLRLADHIAAGATTIPALAECTDADADAVGRLVRHLGTMKIVSPHEDGTLGLTALGRRLLSDDTARARDWLDIEGAVGRADLATFRLLETITTGRPAYPVVYGRDFWADIAADPALSASFNMLMGSQLKVDIITLTTTYDWASAAHVVDVGGGDGTLLSAILSAHPHLRGTLFELPGTASAAEANFAAGGLSGRCEVVSGSFFEALPADGDVYLLSEVLHDWPDHDAAAILRRCATAAAPDGAVVVFEGLLDPGAAAPRTTMDIRMLVYMSGRERTLTELTDLASAAGLTVTAVRHGPHRALLELRPVA
jgi:hypothetical protein